MKNKHLTILSNLFLCALAQRSGIRLPVEGQTIRPGKHFTVQIIRPNSIEGSIEVGLVLGIAQCTSLTFCPPSDGVLGTILFNGHFNPQLHEIPGTPYENFSVVAPADFPAGPAQVASARLHLIGAGPAPVLELNNVTVVVA